MLFLTELVTWTWSVAPGLSYGFHTTCKLIASLICFLVQDICFALCIIIFAIWPNILPYILHVVFV